MSAATVKSLASAAATAIYDAVDNLAKLVCRT